MIIGMSGYARSGKDTVGGFLQELYGYAPQSYAAALKQFVYAQNPLVNDRRRCQDVVDDFGWDAAKTMFPELRRLLQMTGTEAGRRLLGEDIWVHTLMRQLEPGTRYVITDCRFPNEARAIKDAGGEVWRVTRPGVDALNLHPSETSLDDWDFDVIINNDDDLDVLRAKVAFVEELRSINALPPQFATPEAARVR